MRQLSYLLMIVLFLASCNAGKSKHKESKPMIAVTIEPQRYFTEAIAGDKFDVVSIVPKGSSPETYDPTPQQLVSLGDSKAYFRIGYIGFEQIWMDRLTDNTPHIQVFDTSKDVDLIYEEEDHGNHRHAGGVEPHIWNSTGNALIIARNIYKALCQLDKENENYYLSRYDSLTQQIMHTDSVIRQTLQQPGCAQTFMIYHPALSYFARDYGLQQISIEEGGKEPSPAHLKDLVDICREKEVGVIFIQPEFDRRNAEIIAKETRAKIVPINPLSYDWNTEMQGVAQALANNSNP